MRRSRTRSIHRKEIIYNKGGEKKSSLPSPSIRYDPQLLEDNVTNTYPINHYRSNGYYQINEALREFYVDARFLAKYKGSTLAMNIRAIDKLMKPLSQIEWPSNALLDGNNGLTLFRGVRRKRGYKTIAEEFLLSSKKEENNGNGRAKNPYFIDNPTYISTSLTSEVAESFLSYKEFHLNGIPQKYEHKCCMLAIHIPLQQMPKIKGHLFGSEGAPKLSESLFENELLLQRRTRFLLEKVYLSGETLVFDVKIRPLPWAEYKKLVVEKVNLGRVK